MILRLRQRLNELGTRAILDADNEQDRLRKTLLIFASALMGFGSMLWLVIYWAMGIKFSATVPLVYILATAISLAAYLWTLNFDVFRFVQIGLFLFVPFVMQWSIGSYVSSSGVMLWALLAPVGAILVYDARQSIPWFVAYIVLAAVSGVFDYYLASELPKNVSMQTIAVFFTLNFVAMSSIIYVLVSYFMRQREKLQAALDEEHLLLMAEQVQSERLLLNILPAPIAERLKASHDTIADGFANVTVMFADIQDFTRLSGDQPPIVIVESLNQVFSHFDGLAEQYGLEKIKTIGDAYMVAGGLIERHGPDLANDGLAHTHAMLSMALDMLAYMETLPPVGNTRLRLHIGLCTGPVVAGVIGIKKFIYDLWGDTVNLASRVTDKATAGNVLVDVTTYQRMNALYEFEGPQTLDVRGKGEVIAYRLVCRREGVAP
ncbi:MAG TPA: adenylate/guanylate cyclase domain-containing protein, partial [Burkholderiales bacterium]|nr:adenylate/guanylate cyclase domain-containing protein [Burkholderiales bacterium]